MDGLFVTVGELSEYLNCRVIGDRQKKIYGIALMNDSNEELTYLFATYTPGDGIFYTIYAEGSPEEIETLFPPVIANILWTFHIGTLAGY